MTITGAQSLETETVADDVSADVRAVVEQLRADAPIIEGTAKDITDPAAAAETEEAKATRLRNERGQFIAKSEEGADKTAAEPAIKVPDADPAKVTLEQPSTAIEAPKSWSADAKAEWSKASPAIQAAALKREAEINEGGRRWSEEKRTYDETLAPVSAAAQRAGIDVREGIKRLTAANDMLDRDPVAGIRWLADAYKVDLKALAENTQQQPQRPQVDPLVAQLHQDVVSIKTSLTEQAKADTTRTIQAFAAASGHEHFEDVKAHMGQLMLSGLAKDLQDAYDQATWANPTVRAKLLAAQTAAAAAATKARETTEKARRGAISPRSSTSTSAPAVKVPPAHTLNGAGDSVEDDVRAAFRQHVG